MPVDRSSPEKVVASYIKARFEIDKAHSEKPESLEPDPFERTVEVNREHCPRSRIDWQRLSPNIAPAAFTPSSTACDTLS